MRPNAATMPDARPGWCDRLLAALCYVGFGPLLAPWRRVRTRPFVQHHLAQGLAVGMLAVLLALALLAAAVGWAWFIVNHREIVRSVGDADGWAVAVAFLVWAAFMLGGLVLALCGSSRRLPLLHQLTAGSRRRCVAILVNLGAYGLLVLVVGMTCHAAAICRSDDGPAPVYVLYDDMDFFPRWVFQLGAYPIALTADARWGPGSTVVLPLRRPTLDRALEHARVLVLLCHGRDGAVVSGRLCVAAPTPQAGAPGVPRLLGALPIPTHGQDWEPLAVGDRLQLAYITACDGGRNAAGWRGRWPLRKLRHSTDSRPFWNTSGGSGWSRRERCAVFPTCRRPPPLTAASVARGRWPSWSATKWRGNTMREGPIRVSLRSPRTPR